VSALISTKITSKGEGKVLFRAGEMSITIWRWGK